MDKELIPIKNLYANIQKPDIKGTESLNTNSLDKYFENKEKRKEELKEILLKAMASTMGNVSEACHLTKINRSLYYYLYNKDHIFREKIESLKEGLIDYAEQSLFKQIDKGNTTAIIFYLKCKAKHRGYIDTVVQDNDKNETIKVTFSEAKE